MNKMRAHAQLRGSRLKNVGTRDTRLSGRRRQSAGLCCGLVVLVIMALTTIRSQRALRSSTPGPELDSASGTASGRPPVVYVPQETHTSGLFRTCSEAQARKQGELFGLARVRGCPAGDDPWLRLIQSAHSRAKVFVDIGSNKGFTGARFFSLWNPYLGMNVPAYYKYLLKTNTDKTLRECGACGDCRASDGKPFIDLHERLCGIDTAKSSAAMAGKIGPEMAQYCSQRIAARPSIRVLSFDGSKTMIEGTRRALAAYAADDGAAEFDKYPEGYNPTYTVKEHRRVMADAWSFEQAAFLGECQPGGYVTFFENGETGHAQDDSAVLDEFSEKARNARNSGTEVRVPCLTVDQLAVREQLQNIDVLKIDTEGHDHAVLAGAQDLLRRGAVTVLLFEYNKVWPRQLQGKFALEKVVEDLAEDGYVCFLEGKNALVRLTGCWVERFHRERDWSNVICACARQPSGNAVIAALDSYSLAFSFTPDGSPL